MRKLVVLVVVLGAVLFAADRVGAAAAGHEVGKRIAADYSLPATPRVSINGFPFLTQAVNGRYQNVDVQVGDWSQGKITVHGLDVVLAGVSAPVEKVLRNDPASFTADRATATAMVPYDVVQRFAPEGVQSITGMPDGSVQVFKIFHVGGVPVPATITVTVAPVDNGIEVTPVAVKSTAGPTIPLSLVENSLRFTVPLDRLPLGAKLNRIQPTVGGLSVTAVADNVQFSHLPGVRIGG